MEGYTVTLVSVRHNSGPSAMYRVVTPDNETFYASTAFGVRRIIKKDLKAHAINRAEQIKAQYSDLLKEG